MISALTGSIFMDFFLVSLVVWRVSSLFAREEGPFDLFLRLRMLLGTEFDKSSKEVGTNWISKGILCIFCNSIWFGAIGAFFLTDSFVLWLVYLLALSSMAIIIEKYVKG